MNISTMPTTTTTTNSLPENKILRINIIFYMMFCDKPCATLSLFFIHSDLYIYHAFPSHTHTRSQSIFSLVDGIFRRCEWKCCCFFFVVRSFLFMFSVISLFFILAVAINKWNVYPKRILLFVHLFSVCVYLQFSRYSCPFDKYMNIWLECVAIYSYHLMQSILWHIRNCSHSLFDQWFHNKIFKS